MKKRVASQPRISRETANEGADELFFRLIGDHRISPIPVISSRKPGIFLFLVQSSARNYLTKDEEWIRLLYMLFSTMEIPFCFIFT